MLVSEWLSTNLHIPHLFVCECWCVSFGLPTRVQKALPHPIPSSHCTHVTHTQAAVRLKRASQPEQQQAADGSQRQEQHAAKKRRKTGGEGEDSEEKQEEEQGAPAGTSLKSRLVKAHANGATAAALQAASLEGVVKKGGAAVPYVAAPKFAGARPGYCFRKGPQGLGYYVDKPPNVRVPLYLFFVYARILVTLADNTIICARLLGAVCRIIDCFQKLLWCICFIPKHHEGCLRSLSAHSTPD